MSESRKVWIAMEIALRDNGLFELSEISFVGVFDSRREADAACEGLGMHQIAEAEIGNVYRARGVNWMLTRTIV